METTLTLARPVAVTPPAGLFARLGAVLAVALLGLAGGLLMLAAHDGNSLTDIPAAPFQVVRPGDPPVTFSRVPTNGVLTIAVPRGTNAVRAGGELGYILPSIISLKVGDTVAITNNDITPHLVMWAFILPGQTVVRTFTEPGTETYSAGCTVDPTPAGFTTVFVNE